jgi:hypothetical protein
MKMRKFNQSCYRVVTKIALFSLILGLAIYLPMPESTAQTKKADAPKKKVRLEIKCAGKVRFTTEQFEDLIVEALERNGYEIVEDDDESAGEFYFGLLADDGDLDDDGTPDADDPDDYGDGIDDEDQEFIDWDDLDDEDSDTSSSLKQARESFFTPASFRRSKPLFFTNIITGRFRPHIIDPDAAKKFMVENIFKAIRGRFPSSITDDELRSKILNGTLNWTESNLMNAAKKAETPKQTEPPKQDKDVTTQSKTEPKDETKENEKSEATLDAEGVKNLVQDLTDGLESLVDDETALKAIKAKWAKHQLAGKNRKQIVDLLFADVKAVVKDQETLDEIWASWQDR